MFHGHSFAVLGMRNDTLHIPKSGIDNNTRNVKLLLGRCQAPNYCTESSAMEPVMVWGLITCPYTIVHT